MKDWDEEHLLFAIRMADEPEILVRAIREIAERNVNLRAEAALLRAHCDWLLREVERLTAALATPSEESKCKTY